QRHPYPWRSNQDSAARSPHISATVSSSSACQYSDFHDSPSMSTTSSPSRSSSAISWSLTSVRPHRSFRPLDHTSCCMPLLPSSHSNQAAKSSASPVLIASSSSSNGVRPP